MAIADTEINCEDDDEEERIFVLFVSSCCIHCPYKWLAFNFKLLFKRLITLLFALLFALLCVHNSYSLPRFKMGHDPPVIGTCGPFSLGALVRLRHPKGHFRIIFHPKGPMIVS